MKSYYIKHLSLCLFINIVFTMALIAQETSSLEKRIYTSEKVQVAPTIDGTINDKTWGNTKWSSNFTVKGEPVAKQFDSRFKIVYDQEFLYIAMDCFDRTPDSIPLYPSPRDNPSNDWVEFDFDTDLDKKTAFAFAVSPYGVRTDMSITGDDENFDDRWNPKWETKTKITKTGWAAEMKIPFSQFKLSHGNKQEWGLQVTRRIRRKEEISNWQKMLPNAEGWVRNFGTLKGVKDIKVSQQLEKSFNPDRMYSPGELQGDFRMLKSVLKGMHPSLYWYTTKNEMELLFAKIEKELNRPMTEYQFYKMLLPVFNKLGDGHSWIRLSRNYRNHINKTSRMLPIGVKISDDKIFITKYFGGATTLQKGTEILAINGVSADKIIKELVQYVSADGYGESWKLDTVSNDFAYYLSFYFGDVDTFRMDGIAPDGEKFFGINVIGLLSSNFQRNSLEIATTNLRTDNWNFHILEDNIGYLSVQTFARGKRFRDYMDGVFQKIDSAAVQNLIIDVRDNYGGNDSNGMYLYSYLTDKPFKYFESYETRTALKPEVLNSVNCCLSREELNFLEVVSTKQSSGKQLLTDYENSGFHDPNVLIEPQHNAFKGKLYLLMNGGSFSVTSDFCSIAHNDGRATFIGQETGGGYYGNTSGIDKLLQLPHTGLVSRVNFIKFLGAREKQLGTFGRGVMPDFSIKTAQEDVIKGIDPELKFALQLILERR